MNHTEKASQVVRCHGYALVCRASTLLGGRDALVILIDLGEMRPEILECQETTSYTLVVTKQ